MTDKKRNFLDWAKVLISCIVTILTGVGICVNLGNKAVNLVEQIRQIPVNGRRIDTLEKRIAILDVNYIALKASDSSHYVITTECIGELKKEIDTIDYKHLLAKQP